MLLWMWLLCGLCSCHVHSLQSSYLLAHFSGGFVGKREHPRRLVTPSRQLSGLLINRIDPSGLRHLLRAHRPQLLPSGNLLDLAFAFRELMKKKMMMMMMEITGMKSPFLRHRGPRLRVRPEVA